MQLISRAGVSPKSRVIDVGGGDSTLVDDLLGMGLEQLTVLDISSLALTRARNRLGGMAGKVNWMEADVTQAQLLSSHFDVWHDRAVFHFLTRPSARSAYAKLLGRALRPGGFAVVATYAPDGPERCSGLPTMRYSPEELLAELGSDFSLIAAEREEHVTPAGVVQPFVYCLLQGRPGSPTT